MDDPTKIIAGIAQTGTAWETCELDVSENKAMGVMKAGNSFTIEPMINAGSWNDTQWPDGWTAVTVDGKRSAQFEQTLLVTETGMLL